MKSCLSGSDPESNGDDVIDDFSSRAFSCVLFVMQSTRILY